MKNALYRAYVAPWQDRRRAILYAALILGSMGVSFLQMFIAVDLLRFDATGFLISFNARFISAGWVLFPLTTLTYLYAPRRLFILLLFLLEAAAFSPVAWPSLLSVPLAIGLFQALSSTSYWQAVHLAMAAHTTEDARGYEVSLSNIIQALGCIAGYGLASGALAMHISSRVMLAGFAAQMIATGFLCVILPDSDAKGTAATQGKVRTTSIRHELFHDKGRSLLTIGDSIFGVVTDILFSGWLKVIGIGVLGIGISNSLRTVAQSVLSPLTGLWHGKAKGTEMKIGSTLNLTAWLPWCAAPASGILWFSTPLWAGGCLAFRSGLDSRWYKARSTTSIVVRESLLTIGRVGISWVIIPAMFDAPTLYAGISTAIGAAILIGSFFYRPDREAHQKEIGTVG